MPTQTQQPIRAYAHCGIPRCAGNQQEEVEAIRTEDSYTYSERGGDLPGIEGSVVRVNFADESDIPCRTCGRHRELSEDPRPNYDPLSGYAQDGLLEIPVNANGTRFDPSKQAEIQAEASDALQKENAELRERMAKLEGFMLGQGQPGEQPEQGG